MDAGLLKAFFSIVTVVALFGAILFALKKFLKRRTIGGSDVDLKVVSKVALHQKSFLCVVKAGMRTLLVGVSDNNVSLIADLSDEYCNLETALESNTPDLYSITQSNLLKKKIKQQPVQPLKTVANAATGGSTSFSTYLKTAFKRNVN
jgi:flagellar biogenesis protein FliO